MRALRFAVIAAMISISAVESSDAFARAAGGAAGGGAAGGGGAGGAGAGVITSSLSVGAPIRGPKPRPHPPVVRAWSSCYKQDYLYDRYGNKVVNFHGAECLGG